MKKKLAYIKKNGIIWLALIVIIALASLLRFTGIDWDEGAHLHPDERFLSMVVNDIRWPEHFSEYFRTNSSTLNPANNGKAFFVYGTFPVFLTKLIADFTDKGGYEQYTLTGRVLSALFDILTIIVVFLIAQMIFDTNIALLSSLLFAFTTIHIQHSHFFVTDLFAVFFIVLSFYFLLLWLKTRKIIYVVLLGISWGAGLASKMNSILFAFIILLGCIVLLIQQTKKATTQRVKLYRALATSALRIFLLGLFIIIVAFSVFRVLQPYSFSGPHIWNVRLSDSFISSFKEIAKLSSKESAGGYVPAFQWIGAPWYFHIKTLTLWGLGLPLSIFCWLGLILCIYKLAFRKQTKLLLLVAWPLFVIGYQSLQFPKTVRYLLPATPFLIILAAFFLTELYRYFKKTFCHSKSNKTNLVLLRVLFSAIIVSCLLWGTAYESIYIHQQTRLAASAWVYDDVPENTTVTVEPWDDGLPIHLRGRDPPPRLNPLVLDLFGTNNDGKLQLFSEQLSNATYVFITSGRNSKVLPKLNRYPYITTYYHLLFAGKLGFRLEKNFTNYPRLLGFTIPDENAEESFVVYDHPTVLIFKNEQKLNSTAIFNLIKGEQHDSNKTDVVAQ